MNDLADFLLARITEVEVSAKAALRDVIAEDGTVHGEWWAAGDAIMANTPDQYLFVATQHPSIGDTAVAEHIALHDPTRVLADCDVKRRIVKELAEAIAFDKSIHEPWSTTASAGKRVLNFLALPYADHPDYREDWRP